MNKTTTLRNTFLVLLGLFFSSALWAHGGAAGTDTDQCKFELEPNHWIHYTAYQPKAYPAEEFCGNIPNADTLIQLVFDYQDIRYRNMKVSFEVTKEPEGTSIFKQAPKKHKSGTVVLSLPEGVPDPGKYLIHITLEPDEGERLDAHMAFRAGAGQSTTTVEMLLYLLFACAGVYVVYLSHDGFKTKVDEILGNVKDS
ncbi:MAG: hypothetical protein Q9M50_03595 [Methylococcales bacterium]|nr:hypothetical protein [Methylococcales bacterium]